MSPDPKGGWVVRVDASQLEATAVTLDVLARLALAARRAGCRLVLRGASSELAGLIGLAGLSDALGVGPVRPGSTRPRC